MDGDNIEPLSAKQNKPPIALPRIGLALGGGGARGLAHVAILEAFDELNIKPSIIAGTSIGAIYGAAYAAGFSGAFLRDHTIDILSQRLNLFRRLLGARAPATRGFLNPFSSGGGALLDPEALIRIIMPNGMPERFEDLKIPLMTVASDFYAQEAVVMSRGPLGIAVAASMSLPALFSPIRHEGRTLIDGGLTNPLPFDLLKDKADIVVAIDVTGTPPEPKGEIKNPTALEALIQSAFLFERSIVNEKLNWIQPDIHVRGGTSQFQVLEFLKSELILQAAEPAKAELKEKLLALLPVELAAPTKLNPT